MAGLAAARRTSTDAPAGLGGRMLNGRHVKMFKPVPSHALAKLKAARGEGSRRLAGHRAPPSVDDPEPARKRRRTPGTMHALNPNLYDKHDGVRRSPFPLPFPPSPPISDHCHISSRAPTDGIVSLLHQCKSILCLWYLHTHACEFASRGHRSFGKPEGEFLRL